MNAVDVLAACAAAGVVLEPRGDRLGIRGPGAAVASLRDEIIAQKPALLSLLQAEGCVRCGGARWRQSADGAAWCQACDWRRFCLDLACLAGYPRLRLTPMLYVVRGGEDAWLEVARGVAGASLWVAVRRLRGLCGDAAATVEPSASPLHPWAC